MKSSFKLFSLIGLMLTLPAASAFAKPLCESDPATKIPSGTPAQIVQEVEIAPNQTEGRIEANGVICVVKVQKASVRPRVLRPVYPVKKLEYVFVSRRGDENHIELGFEGLIKTAQCRAPIKKSSAQYSIKELREQLRGLIEIGGNSTRCHEQSSEAQFQSDDDNAQRASSVR